MFGEVSPLWPPLPRRSFGNSRAGDVWFFDRPVRNDLHPTMKPIGLVERTIRNSSKTRDIILDRFAGSGTTLMAAEATGRRAVLLEVDPRYCDVIVQRWQEGTGKTARLQSDGRTLEEIAAERLVGTSSEALA